MISIDEALIEKSYFLQPSSFATQPLEAITAKHYRPYERILDEGGVIGIFNNRFRFEVDKAMTAKYAVQMPLIAEGMLRDHKDELHKRFHAASMSRGTLDVAFEWELSQATSLTSLSLKESLRVKGFYQIDTLVVLRPDLPTYDIIVPQGVQHILEIFPPDASEIDLPEEPKQ